MLRIRISLGRKLLVMSLGIQLANGKVICGMNKQHTLPDRVTPKFLLPRMMLHIFQVHSHQLISPVF